MDSLAAWNELARPPATAAGLGIPIGLVEDLFARRVFVERETTIHAVSVGLGITMPVAKELADSLRNKKIIEYYGMEGRDYRIGLTEAGYKTTTERMVGASYASYLPVSLDSYTQTILRQKSVVTINRETIRAAFGDLVVADEMLDQLGPAFLSDGAIFLYGPPGTGKTSLAERMIRLHTDAVLVPRAIEIDGAIITVYDPATHHAIDPQPPGIDQRWVVCNRPLVLVGGELNSRMLDLEYDSISGSYKAPIQLQANNGILVVDDFGRQQLLPTELLNRWIVPLSRGIDFLRLVNGAKFTVPFELKLVASTNLDPHELGDEAFLRRLRNKVYVGAVTEVAFNWILVRAAKARNIAVNAEAAQHLRRVSEHFIGELRPYVAIDFLDLMVGIAEYEGLPHTLDIRMIDRVAQIYFVTSGASGPPASNPTQHPPASRPPNGTVVNTAPAHPSPVQATPSPAAMSPAAMSPAAMSAAVMSGSPAPSGPVNGGHTAMPNAIGAPSAEQTRSSAPLPQRNGQAQSSAAVPLSH